MAKFNNDTILDNVGKMKNSVLSSTNDKNYFEETESWKPQLDRNDVFNETIPLASSPSTADINVTANPLMLIKLTDYSLTEIPASNGQGYSLYATPGDTNSERLINFLVPQKYGNGYACVLKTNTTVIPLSAGQYEVDYANGIVRFDPSATPAIMGWSNLNITIYRYIGSMLGESSSAESGGYNFTFVDADITGGFLTVPHNLGLVNNVGHITIKDNNDNMISVGVVFSDNNTLIADFNAYIPITGTWNGIVGGGSSGSIEGIDNIIDDDYQSIDGNDTPMSDAHSELTTRAYSDSITARRTVLMADALENTTNVASLSGSQSVGGAFLMDGQIVVLLSQTSSAQNGPYVVRNGAWEAIALYKEIGMTGHLITVTYGAEASTVWIVTSLSPSYTAIKTSSDGSVDARNGVRISDDYVELGGTLTKDTVVEGPHSVTFRTTNNQMLLTANVQGNGYSMCRLLNTSVELATYTDSLQAVGIIANRGKFTVYDQINLTGMEYDADYSANFHDRSIVDKAYVDSMVGGNEWVSRTPNVTMDTRAIAYGNGLFVTPTYGEDEVVISPDGITWTSIVTPTATDNNWYAITYGNGMFIILGINSNDILISKNGLDWTLHSIPEANVWMSVVYGKGLFVAVAASGTNSVLTSPDGIVWTTREDFNMQWGDITYSDGLFVAVANGGVSQRVMTSPDGITWTQRIATSNNAWSAIAYGNGLFVAVSSSGTNRIMTSPDGITWTTRTAPEENNWNSIVYGSGMFVVLSETGTTRCMVSVNGIDWISKQISSEDWGAIAYGNGMFIAVSRTGECETSGTQQLNRVALDGLLPTIEVSSPSTNTTAGTAGEDLVTGDLCYLNSNGRYYKTNADSIATSRGLLRMANEDLLTGVKGEFIKFGGRMSTTGLTTGAEYYISTVDGDYSMIKPILSGHVVRLIGYAISSVLLEFSPSATYIEVL